MTADDIKSVVREVLAEQKLLTASDVDHVALKTIATLLTSFGIEEEDRIELRADFSHLRRWRKSVEQAQNYTLRAIVTVIATGIAGAIWMGIKASMGK